MTLQRKFAVLLALLGVTIASNLGMSVWAVGMLDREQRWPMENLAHVLQGLNRTKRLLWEQAELLGASSFPGRDGEGPQPTAGDAQRLERLTTAVIAQVAELEESEAYILRSGISTARNIRQRVDLAAAAARRWLATGDADARLAAADGLYELHELIERLEARLLDDAEIAVEWGRRVRTRLILILAASLLSVALAFSLSFRLYRRWVVEPVERLREATERIAHGDLRHRIPVRGRDELARLSEEVNTMAATVETVQRERIERERLAAIGEMSRRVAHNIRNPLAGIRSLAEMTRSDLADRPALAEVQERIMRTVDRFAAWLSDLLSLSSPLEVSPHEVPVAAWLHGAVETHRPAAEAASLSPPGQTALFNAWEDAVECAKCGGRMVRTGACYTCRDCGQNTGCG